MKRLTTYITEKFRISKNMGDMSYKYHPRTQLEFWKCINKIIQSKENPKASEILDFNEIDVSKMTDFTHLFFGSIFKKIDISTWNVSNVKKFDKMFFKCDKLESVGDISNWDVSNAESMIGMFAGCKKLTEQGTGDLMKWQNKIKNPCDTRLMFDNSGIDLPELL